MSDTLRLTARTGALCGTIVLGLLIFTVNAFASDTTDQVKAELDQLTAIVKDPALQEKAKEEARKSMVKNRVVRWFDLQEMARRSLAGYWAKRSGQERKDFVELFGDLFVESYT